MKKYFIALALTAMVSATFAADTHSEICATIDQSAKKEGLPWKTRDAQLREAGCPSIAREAKQEIASARYEHCYALREERTWGNWKENDKALFDAGCSRLR